MPNVLERLNDALAGRYSVESEIGRGGMATVFLAEDLKHHRKVAIKVLKPEIATEVATERFLREIEIVAGLTHPHILPLYDSGEADGLLYCVMPYIEGASLLERMRSEKQLPLDEALQIATEVAGALGYAHEQGLIHRDIKPANILLEHGHAVVADFGIARAVEQAGGARLTQTGVAVGTPAYMSPEQGTGAADLDGRTDIYALGCVLYEMLAGDPPYTGVTPLSVIKRHALEPVPHVRTIRDTAPESVEYAITRAMAKVPADRFKTAEEFAAALTAPVPRTASGKRRLHTGVLAAAAIFAALVAGWQLAGRLGRSHSSDPEQRGARPGEVRITETGRALFPALSPDGRFLAYLESAVPFDRNVANAATMSFRLMLRDISEAVPGEPRLVTPVQSDAPLAWSPDGQTLAFYGRVRDSRGLFLISPFGTEVDQVTSESALSADWAPDGNRLAAITARMQQIGIFALDEDGSAELTREFRLSSTYDRLWTVKWSPIGERLAVVSDSAGIWTVWAVSPDGETLDRLVTRDEPVAGIRWSPSGDAIYYHEYSTNAIARLPLAGDSAGVAVVVASDCSYDFSVARDTGTLACERTAPRDARLSISTPSADSVIDLGLDPAFRGPPVASSDGTMLAYVEHGSDGRDLVVYSVANGTSNRITFRGDLSPSPGSVAWSPDDAFIAYTAPGPDGSTTLWFVPSTGGVSVRVSDLAPGFQVVWGTARDPIVEMPNGEWRLLAPPAVSWDSALVRGGVLTEVVGRRLAAGDSAWAISDPVVSPSGDQVALLWYRGARREDGAREDAGIWLLSLDGSSERLLARRGVSAVAPRPFGWTVSGDGIYVAVGSEIHVVDVADGGMTKLFDPGGYCSAVLLGERFVCVDDVAEVDIWVIRDFDPHAVPAPDLQSESGELREIQLTDHGRVWQVSPAVSPDGRYVAYSMADRPRTLAMQYARNFNQYLMVAEIGSDGIEGEPRLLTLMQSCAAIRWSPDGRHVLVSGVVRENRGVFLVPLGGGRMDQISDRIYSMLDWSPDGTRLAVRSDREIGFLRPVPGGSGDLEGRFPLPTEYQRIGSLAWSPNNERIAAVLDSSGVAVFWTVAPDGKDARRIGSEEPPQDFAWAAGSDAVYFSRGPQPRELVRMGPVDGSGSPVMEPLLEECRWFSVSSDGRRLACQRVTAVGQYWLKSFGPAADSALLTPDTVSYRGDPWPSPDATRIAFVEKGEEGSDLYVLSLQDGSKHRLTHRGDVGGSHGMVAWSPDGAYLAYSAKGPDDTGVLWFVPSDGGPSVRAEGVTVYAGLAWSPADNPIVQIEPDRGEYVVVEPIDQSWGEALAGRSAVSDLNTRPVVPLDSLDAFFAQRPAVSPDGRTVALTRFRTDEESSGVWLLSIHGDSHELLFRSTPEMSAPTPVGWTQEGDGVYVRNGADLYLVDRGTREISPVATPAGVCGPEELQRVGRFLCSTVDIQANLWLIENFDPYVE